MVRRVGFGDDQEEPPTKASAQKSIADQAMDRFRNRARIKKAREKEERKTNRSKGRRIGFLVFWLAIWLGMAGAMIYGMASQGLGTNVLGLVIVTGASVMVTSKVIKRIIQTAKGDGRRDFERPENF